jgi:hypothetical protein
MNESTHDAQKRSDTDDESTTTSDETKHCPECGDDILSITRRGPSTATAQPCGHSLGSLRVRDLATTSRRAATDGGQPKTEDAVYFRVEGISPDDVGDDFLAYASEIFADLSETYDITGVVPVINEEYDPRLRPASDVQHTALQEFAAWLSGELGLDASAREGLGCVEINATRAALRDNSARLEAEGFNTELYLDEEPPALHVHPRPGDLQDGGPDEDAKLVADGGQDVEAVDFSVNHEELMGRELLDLNAAYNALDAYYDGHTDGHVTMAEGGRCLVVITQNRRFKHFQTFQQENALRIANVTAVTTQEDGGATEAIEPRLKVEIKAAEGVTA